MTKVSFGEFEDLVTDAYGHLYDLVYLRSHPLLEVLVPDISLSAKQRGWELHRLLLGVIDEIKPPPQAPAFSRHWRRHELMVLRYIKALEPQVVADELNISRRHYYREHKIALEAISGILWHRYVEAISSAAGTASTAPSSGEMSRLELLRLEAARLGQARRLTHLAEVVEDALPVLHELLRRNDVLLDTSLPAGLPSISVDERLLRQVLLGLIGYVVGGVSDATLTLDAEAEGERVRLRLRIQPPAPARLLLCEDARDRISALHEMVAMQQGELRVICEHSMALGFDILLPVSSRIVLVVDDNEDVLALFRRYLTPHGFQIVTAQDADQALDLAARLEPYAITVDLMMPRRDGWDLIQALLNRPETQHIPIVVCSILNQKELALSLGATAFLEKPVNEQALLSALQALA
ncbi:MAG: response regulator [Anaerolineae bacterium]